MPRPVAKKYTTMAKSLLRQEGHQLDDDRVNQLAAMLRDAKALDKPGTFAQGVIVVSFHQDELGEINADVQLEFCDGHGNEQTPSAEFAVWLMENATDTLAELLPSEDEPQ